MRLTRLIDRHPCYTHVESLTVLDLSGRQVPQQQLSIMRHTSHAILEPAEAQARDRTGVDTSAQIFEWHVLGIAAFGHDVVLALFRRANEDGGRGLRLSTDSDVDNVVHVAHVINVELYGVDARITETMWWGSA